MWFGILIVLYSVCHNLANHCQAWDFFLLRECGHYYFAAGITSYHAESLSEYFIRYLKKAKFLKTFRIRCEFQIGILKRLNKVPHLTQLDCSHGSNPIMDINQLEDVPVSNLKNLSKLNLKVSNDVNLIRKVFKKIKHSKYSPQEFIISIPN